MIFLKLVNNLRRGFATNSSSSHSMIYFKEPVCEPGVVVTADSEFGWNDFALDTTLNKLFYVVTGLLQRILGWNSTKKDIEEAYDLYGHLFPEFNLEDFQNAARGYVDHQSASYAPIDEQIMFARDPHIVFFGGNDNDGTDVGYHMLQYPEDSVEWGESMSWGERMTYKEAKEEFDEYRW